jgi:hypothetical protein
VSGGTTGFTPDATRAVFGLSRLVHPQTVYTVASGQEYSLFRQASATPDFAVTEIWLCFQNFYTLNQTSSPEQVPTNSGITVSCTLEDGSNYYPMTFDANGLTSIVIPAGEWRWARATVPSWVSKKFMMRTHRACALGEQAISHTKPVASFGAGEALQLSATTLASLLGGGTVTTNASGTAIYGYGPTLGLVKGSYDGRPVVMIIGDSIGNGAGTESWVANDRCDVGYIPQGLSDPRNGLLRIPYGQCGRSGTHIVNWSEAANNGALTIAMLDSATALNGGKLPFTDIICEHGVNSSGLGAAGMQAAYAVLWAYLKTKYGSAGVKLYQTTLTTRTSQNNNTGWTSTAAGDQTITDGVSPIGGRYIVNAWLRNCPSPLDGIIDPIPNTVDSQRGDQWAPRAFSTTLAAAASANATSISLADAPPLGECLVLGVGNGTDYDAAGYYVQSVSGTGPYTITFAGYGAKLGKAQTSGNVVKGVNTRDGIHPSPLCHQLLMSPAVWQWKEARLKMPF